MGTGYSAWHWTLCPVNLFSPSKMNLSDGLSKGLRIQRSQEACLPFRLCLKAPLAVSSGRVSWLWDRAGSEAGIRNIPDSHTPLFTPLSMSELEGATVQAGILGLSWHPLCCSNTCYHCYVSNISQARNLRLMEEVNFLSWFLLFFWGGAKTCCSHPWWDRSQDHLVWKRGPSAWPH